MYDREHWKEFYENKYNARIKQKTDKKYGTASFIIFLFSFGLFYGAYYVSTQMFAGKPCPSLMDFNPETLHLSIVLVFAGIIFWLISIAYAGAGIATDPKYSLGIITIFLTIGPVVAVGIMFAFGINITDFFPTNSISSTTLTGNESNTSC